VVIETKKKGREKKKVQEECPCNKSQCQNQADIEASVPLIQKKETKKNNVAPAKTVTQYRKTIERGSWAFHHGKSEKRTGDAKVGNQEIIGT